MRRGFSIFFIFSQIYSPRLIDKFFLLAFYPTQLFIDTFIKNLVCRIFNGLTIVFIELCVFSKSSIYQTQKIFFRYLINRNIVVALIKVESLMIIYS